MAEGLAQVSTFPPDVKYTDLYVSLQDAAQAAGLGFWGGAVVGDVSPADGGAEGADDTDPFPGEVVPPEQDEPAPEPPTVEPAPEPTPPQSNCSPAYPTVCIPPAPPDLDCGEIPFRRFTVLSPDPHGLDRDRDGVGCES